MTGAFTKKGVNAQRKILSGYTNYDAEINDLVTTAPPKFMFKAVVVDVIFDPHNQRDELIETYQDVVANSDLLLTAPRNSIIARVVSNGSDKRSQTPIIFYPTLSHTHEPLKPGEKVWVFFEDSETSRELGYWLSRVVNRIDVEDPNFTHADRAFSDDLVTSTIDRAGSATQTSTSPGFPNGSGTEEGFTLAEHDAYEVIEKNAIANRVVTKEPVPRYSKRPGDWVAESSNNSIIVLGEDRTGPAADIEGSTVIKKPEDDKASFAGSFDIVAGRGVGNSQRYPDPGTTPSLTSPRVIKNSRGTLETDKSTKKTNKREGDPDFENDLTRLYGSMRTDVDGNFGKELPALNDNEFPEVVTDDAALIAKSNNVRVIARDDGTIRIIKEGVEDGISGPGRAVIMMEKDGTIMIDGPTIIFGSGIEKSNGEGTQLFFGRDAKESTVLGDTLKSLLTAYSSNIESSISGFSDALTQLATTLSTPPNNLGNFAIPLPGLIAISAVLASAPTLLKTQVAAHTQSFQQDLIKILSRVGKTK